MHIANEITIAQQEAAAATARATEAWAALQAAHEGRPRMQALRAAYYAVPAGSLDGQVAYRAWSRAVLVELYDLWSAHQVAEAVAYSAGQRLEALRALSAADTYECAAGAGVAQ